jgi:hypothetical protein
MKSGRGMRVEREEVMMNEISTLGICIEGESEKKQGLSKKERGK